MNDVRLDRPGSLSGNSSSTIVFGDVEVGLDGPDAVVFHQEGLEDLRFEYTDFIRLLAFMRDSAGLKTDESRSSYRIAIAPAEPLETTLTWRDRVQAVFAIDISLTGMQVRAQDEQPLDCNAEVKVRLRLAPYDISLLGRVIWVKDDRAGIGFYEHREEPPAELREIYNLIQKNWLSHRV